MLGTAIMESDLKYLQQEGGPAVSFFQLEPATVDDIYVRYLSVNLELKAYVDGLKLMGFPLIVNVQSNPLFSCALARVKYWMDPEPLPTNLEGIAKTWKRVYNTEEGAGTVSQFLYKWGQHARGL